MHTQEDMAREAGVNRSTVSRALRGDPRISQSERERICKIAQRMGYRPNPMITALMERVRQSRPPAFQSVLAWVAPGWEQSRWEKDRTRVERCRGASQRAKELGYALQRFFPTTQIQESRTFLRALRARGVRGLLLDVPRSGNVYEDWDLQGLSAVTVGFRLGSPALHFVGNDWFAATWSLLHHLHKRGYRRMALAVDADPSHLHRFRIIGGFQAYQTHFLSPSQWTTIWQSGGKISLQHWLTKTRPDVLICDRHDAPWLADGGGPPLPCPLAAVETTSASPIMGMELDPAAIGRSAVDLLTAHLIRNETGIPSIQKGSLIEPAWHEPPLKKAIPQSPRKPRPKSRKKAGRGGAIKSG